MAEFLSQSIQVAVLGSGGREHALAVKLSESPFCKQVVVLPGNPGMALNPKLRCEPVKNFEPRGLVQQLRELSKTEPIGLVVIGPDDLLAQGMADLLLEAGFAVFGPSRAAAELEWSKAFAKEVLQAAHVPTAGSALLDSTDPVVLAKAVSDCGGYPVVLKFDGLALGKGVRICGSEGEALNFLAEVFDQQVFARGAGRSGRVLVEEMLRGHEVSLFAITDGESYVLLDPACDHKRLNEGNVGPNTGGMGAYSPVPWFGAEKAMAAAEQIFPPVLAEMRKRGRPFQGLLYAGLMARWPDFWVLEFNARFGDPETQAILPRLQSDLLPLLLGVAAGEFSRASLQYPPRWSKQYCVNIVAASRGYPEKPETGFEVPEARAETEPGTRVYFAGVKAESGGLRTSGGRVFSVSALGDTLSVARARAEARLGRSSFEGMQYRRDIGRLGEEF